MHDATQAVAVLATQDSLLRCVRYRIMVPMEPHELRYDVLDHTWEARHPNDDSTLHPGSYEAIVQKKYPGPHINSARPLVTCIENVPQLALNRYNCAYEHLRT